MNALEPRGPIAEEIAGLWWLMFWLAFAVFIAVMAALGAALWRSRRGEVRTDVEESRDTTLVIIAGAAIPLVILFVVQFSSHQTGRTIHGPPADPAVVVEIIGHQFWWEVRYPDHDVVTANEIHVPVGQPVEIHLVAADVIHSFWVPQLAGKLDLNPGMTTVTWIQADEPGVYRGPCAEFCGIQHALMQLLLIAEPPDEFNAWLEARQQPAAAPADAELQRGEQVFVREGCALCHVVRGRIPEGAMGLVGPDLTHFGSRRTLGAAVFENNEENLRTWILDPDRMKPGVRMPATPLSDEDVQALVAYLMSLQ